MARIFIDGFEAGDLKLWNTVSGATAVTGVSGMDGTYCLNCRLYMGDYISKTLPSNAEYYAAFIYRPTNGLQSAGVMGFYNSSTLLGRLTRDTTTGALKAYRNNTLLGTSTTILNVNTSYIIETRYKPANSGGVFQVKINGTLEIDYSGDTTDSSTSIDGFFLGSVGYVASAYFDNVVIDDAAWPGNTKIQAVVPTGAGNSTQWTPSAGSNYQCVDEKPPSEADYNSTNTTGHLDQFAAGDLSGSIETIKCVQVQALAKKEGSPTPLNLQLSVRTRGADFASGNKAVPTASAQLWNLWEANPNTTSPWEVPEVNAAEIGVKAVA